VKPDTISIVEAPYDCESDTRAWLCRLLEHVVPKLDRGFGLSASAYVPNLPIEQIVFELREMTKEVSGALFMMSVAHADVFHRLNLVGPPHNMASKNAGRTARQAVTWTPYVDYLHPLGVRDVLGVLARDPSGHAIVLSAPTGDLRQPSRPEVATWSQIAAHISAGARVRRAVEKLVTRDLAEGADAVLSSSGSLVHCERDAQGPDNRDALRRAAKAIDLARSKARSNEDEALNLWQGLVVGRWSLVEQFDSDGRRFMVARRNDPQVTDPRALGLRERQVLGYVAMGHPAQLIAYSLGVSPSSVSTARRTAMRKLGLQTTADVVRLFAEAPPSVPSQER
jgi:DNA-binding CsgD family transcriptional regulator